jgi:hypothetical protein
LLYGGHRSLDASYLDSAARLRRLARVALAEHEDVLMRLPELARRGELLAGANRPTTTQANCSPAEDEDEVFAPEKDKGGDRMRRQNRAANSSDRCSAPA